MHIETPSLAARKIASMRHRRGAACMNQHLDPFDLLALVNSYAQTRVGDREGQFAARTT
jgi:hypothetical protein